MRKVLLVDDLRDFRMPPQDADLIIARTSGEALAILAGDVTWDEIWLDHDLGDATGVIDSVMPVVDYMSERAFNDEPVLVREVLVHTSNPAGRATMLRVLDRYGYTARPMQAETYFLAQG